MVDSVGTLGNLMVISNLSPHTGFVVSAKFFKNCMASFYEWSSTTSRQSHYEKIVYFLPQSFQKFHLMTSEG